MCISENLKRTITSRIENALGVSTVEDIGPGLGRNVCLGGGELRKPEIKICPQISKVISIAIVSSKFGGKLQPVSEEVRLDMVTGMEIRI